MTSKTARRLGIAGTAAVAATALAGVALANTITGPSSSQSPYVEPSQPGVVVKSILTVGDSVNDKPDGSPYRMVGIPDGLGAYDNGNGTFTVLMNHELTGTAGATRAHGATGAFVSKWTIRKGSLKVLAGEDLIQRVALWNPATDAYSAPATGVVLNRLCSADLPARNAFYDPATGKGYPGRIFMNGEESDDGRAFAHVVDGPEAGTSYELPYLGRFAWENSVTQPGTGAKTVVVGLDDTTPGQVYVYVGDKRSTGNAAERAGLVGGTLYGVRVVGYEDESITDGIPSGTRFELVSLGDVSELNEAALDAASDAADVTRFRRPEDGAWNPRDRSAFLFVTTASFTQESRLFRLDFDDAGAPTLGGTIDMLLEGTEGPRMMDNMTVTGRGQVLIQEDPGGQDHLAKIWRYSLTTDTVTEVAAHDADRFTPGAPGFLTRDEESSGIIPMDDILGEGWFLGDVQAHYDAGDAELVQGGQLFAMHVPPGRTR